jgi:hypothetical protein
LDARLRLIRKNPDPALMSGRVAFISPLWVVFHALCSLCNLSPSPTLCCGLTKLSKFTKLTFKMWSVDIDDKASKVHIPACYVRKEGCTVRAEQTRVMIYKSDSQSRATRAMICKSDSQIRATRAMINKSDSQNWATRAMICKSDSQSGATRAMIYKSDSQSWATRAMIYKSDSHSQSRATSLSEPNNKSYDLQVWPLALAPAHASLPLSECYFSKAGLGLVFGDLSSSQPLCHPSPFSTLLWSTKLTFKKGDSFCWAFISGI